MSFVVAQIKGDIKISGIIDVHERGNNGNRCGKIQRQRGIMYVEAMLFAVDKINQNNGSFLYGNKLWPVIHDTCAYRPYLRHIIVQTIKSCAQGIIGPGNSVDSTMAANGFYLWRKTIISYGATSQELSDRGKYPNMYRTVPTDEYQVKIMVDIAKKFNWTYVSCIYSYGSYGERGSLLFEQEATAAKICIPTFAKLPRNGNEADYRKAILKVLANGKTTVIYLFLSEWDLRGFLQVAEKMKDQLRNITLLGTESWGGLVSVVQEARTVANGALTIQTQTDEVEEFKRYFLSLKPENNKRNIWFKEFWEDLFNCTISHNNQSLLKPCTGKESLRPEFGYYANTPVLTVINAVYTYAHIFKEILEERCIQKNISGTVCVNISKVLKRHTNRIDIYNKMRSIKFKEPFRNRTFHFNQNGAVDEGYDILNFHKSNVSDQYMYSKIGEWRDIVSRAQSTSNVTEKNIYFNSYKISWKTKNLKPPISACSVPCSYNKIAVYKDILRCCWDCKDCPENSIIRNNTCIPCTMDLIPDPNLKYCMKLPQKFTGIQNRAVSLQVNVLLALMGVGTCCTALAMALFIKNFSERFIKASGRELCLNMMVGIMAAYLSPIVFIVKPSAVVCALQRFVIGFSFTLCYAPLMLKLNRIYRIFSSAKIRIVRPTLVSPQSQICISVGLSLISVLIGLASVVGEKPKIIEVYPSHREFVVQRCELTTFTIIFNLLYSSMLMLVSSWYAFKTRMFPKNYNETKYIGFTVYSTCLILSLTLPSIFFINDPEGNYKPFILCFMCVAVATLNLTGLFGQKIWLILRPEKQTDVFSTDSVRTVDVQNSSVSPTVIGKFKVESSSFDNGSEA